MIQFILGAIGVVALSEISKRGKMPMMAKGGVLKKFKYVPNRNIESVELSKGNKTIDVDGADVLDGVYVRKGKYAKGGGVGKVKSEKVKQLEKKINELEGKRSSWISSAKSEREMEARSVKKSPFDDEISKLDMELYKQIESETEVYDLPQSNKTGEEKIKWTVYDLSRFLQYGKSYSKFLKSLKTPTQKEAFRRLNLASYQKKYGYKPIINKTKDTIRIDSIRK